MSQLLNKLTNLVVSKITNENLIQNNNYMEIEENTFYKDIDYNFKLCLHFHNDAGSFDDFNDSIISIESDYSKNTRKLNDDFNICVYYIPQSDTIENYISVYKSLDHLLFYINWFLNYDENKMVFDLSVADEYCSSISNNLDLPWDNNYTGYALNEDVDEFHIHFYFDTNQDKED